MEAGHHLHKDHLQPMHKPLSSQENLWSHSTLSLQQQIHFNTWRDPKKIISYTFLKSRQMLNQIIPPNLSKIVLDASNWAHYLTKYGKMRTLPHKNIKSNKNKPIHRQQTSKHPKWRYKKSKRTQTKIWRWDIENNTVSLHSLGSGDAQEEQEATDPRQRRDHRHWNRRCTSGDADPKTSERDQASKASSFSVLVTVRKYRELSG